MAQFLGGAALGIAATKALVKGLVGVSRALRIAPRTQPAAGPARRMPCEGPAPPRRRRADHRGDGLRNPGRRPAGRAARRRYRHGGPARTVTATPQPAGTASRHPPSPPPTLAGPVTLTTADNGAAVRLHAGQQVAVALASAGSFSWHVPAAAGTAMRRVSASGGYPASSPRGLPSSRSGRAAPR